MEPAGHKWLGFVKYFEAAVTVALAIMMAVVVLIATVELAWAMISAILDAGTPAIPLDRLQEVFGVFLLVLVGLELLETIRSYIADRGVRVEVVLAAALIAVARKVILLDAEKYGGFIIMGLAVLVIALAGSYYLLRMPQRVRGLSGDSEGPSSRPAGQSAAAATAPIPAPAVDLAVAGPAKDLAAADPVADR